jgi:hypothetical protein
MEFIYIFSNNEFKNKIKIGRTDKHPEIRADQLNRQTGTIGKYKCEWFTEVQNSEIIEKTIHYYLRDFQYDKEIFTSTMEYTITLIELIVKQFEYIYYFNRALVLNNEELLALIELYEEMINEDFNKDKNDKYKRAIETLKFGSRIRKKMKTPPNTAYKP